MKTKETRIRRSLFHRVPMAEELLLGEIIYLVVGGMVIGVVSNDRIQWIIGFLLGVILAIGLMIHMALSVEDSISMYEADALKHTRKSYIFRMIVLIIVFLMIIFLKVGNIIAALLGLMALKVSAYIQPFTHKFIQKFKSKGR